MARRVSRAPFVRTARRQNLWLNINIGDIVLAGSTSVLLATLNAAALALRPFTIVRSHMQAWYSSDQTGAAETPFGAFGHIVVKDSAAAVGITAIPTPSTDTDADWHVWQGMISDFVFVTGVGFDAQAGVQYPIDSKGMRKVGPDDDLAVVFEQSASVGGNIIVRGRALIKLH